MSKEPGDAPALALPPVLDAAGLDDDAFELPFEGLGRFAPAPPAAAPRAPKGPTRAALVGQVRRLAAELALRSTEALKLYEPLPHIECFHASMAKERMLRGSNRAGKSLGAAVEVARAVTGQDPYKKYPARDGIVGAIGLDERHCGDPMFKLLTKPGQFRIVKDEVTLAWRVFRPWADEARRAESRPAPAMIPKRFISDVAWADKKRGIPSQLKLTTGWVINFYSSKGCPPNGIQIDLWWIDEECENEAWYPEISARVLDRRGRGFWSATPQVANQQLYDLHVRAGVESAKENPAVYEAVCLLAENPFIPQEEKDALAEKLTDEERRVRIEGEFALTGFKIYPDFSMDIHGHEVEQVPHDWARYLVVDPGRQVCAVLFGAVPPPRVGDFLLLYQELYILNCDAEKFGRAVAAMSRDVVYEALIIDAHAGRVTEMGSGKNVELQYRAALQRHKVQAKNGCNFFWGSDDVKGGIEKVHDFLRIRPDGSPKLRVAPHRLPKLEWEAKRYHYKRVKMLATDEPEKRHDHLMDCLRYLCMYDPRWIKPQAPKKSQAPAVRSLAAKKKFFGKDKKEDGSKVRFGPTRRPRAEAW